MARGLFGVFLFCCCGSAACFRPSSSEARAAVAEHQQLKSSSSSSKDDKGDDKFGGVFLGLALWAVIPCMIWNNERIAIKQYKLQLKAERWAIHVDNVSQEPMEDMFGRIVYLSGEATCAGVELADSVFTKVKSTEKIKLRRLVEMRQWKAEEQKDDQGNHRGWKYEAVWEDHDLGNQGERSNPPMPFASTRRQDAYRVSAMSGFGDKCAEAEHKDVRVGAYYLVEYVIRELQRWSPKEDVEASHLELKGKELAGNSAFSNRKPQLQGDGFWYWSSTAPEIGDVRVKFEELEPGPISICGILTKTGSGSTFVPVLHADSKVESAAAEFGGGDCCLRVKELHYDSDVDEEEFLEDLKGRPIDLTSKEKKQFEKQGTAKDVTSYNADADLDDLCCVGPFGPNVVKLMHWLGLEEEFLAVHEEDLSLDDIMKQEGNDASSRHNACRFASLLCLIMGSFAIISPITTLLTGNWLVAALGGAALSAILCCGACLCSTAAFCCVMSTAWLYYRPILAFFGFACVGLCSYSIYIYGDELYQKAHASQQPSAAPTTALLLEVPRAFLAAHRG